MKLRGNTLFLQIVLPFALLLILTMIGLGLYLNNFLRQSHLDTLRQNMEAETRLVADRLADPMRGTVDAGMVSNLVRWFSPMLNARVTVIDANGTVLADSYTEAEDMENHLDRPEVQDALRSGIGSELRYSDTLQTDMLYTAAPVMDGKVITGVVRLAVSTHAIQRSERQITGSILTAIGIATLLAVLLSLLITAYTVRPIQELTRSTQQLAEGRPVELGSSMRRDEIGQLQNGFQFMAHQLDSRINELRTERSKMEAVLSNMTDGILIVDTQGIVQLINPAALRMFHIGHQQAVKRSITEVVRSHQLVELWRRSVASGEQETTTLELPPSRLFIQAIATQLGSALPEMTLLLIQDLTRVRRLETVRRDFISNVSHELRTPLASLKALTETLAGGALEDPPAARNFLQLMETEIDNLTQLVQELLELSRIESNRFPLERARISPCDLLRPAVERMTLQAERAGLRIHTECPDDLPAVQADAERLQQVLVNLIHNAIKFTPPGGEITASARAEGSQVTFSVRDTGVGIDPEVLPRIFERFYKADRSRSGGGTGLGLSIARHIIEAHGGRIWAESELRRGSTFHFTLPSA